MAIDAVERAAEENREQNLGDLVVYHSIVHNNTVVQRLEAEHQVHFVEDLADLEAMDGMGDTVVFSAHGVSPAVRMAATKRNLTTIDATCPLVAKVHSEAKRYAKMGYKILLIGDSADHQEIIGTYGEAPESITLIQVLSSRENDPRLANPHEINVSDPDKTVILTQTTLSVDDVDKTIDILRQRFPSIVLPSRDDLCYATKNRQSAVREIAPNVDTFIVVSSPHSSNGMRLVELADSLVGRAYRIENLDELKPEWLGSTKSLGITSAASTPDDLVQQVVEYLRELNPHVEIIEEGEWENIEFRLPKRIQPASQ